MLKRNIPYKTLCALFVCVFMLSLALDIPETNAFLKETDSKPSLTAVGDLNVGIVDTDGISTLSVGASEDRRVTIKNAGDAAMFVRLLVHPTLESSEGIQRTLDKEAVIQGGADDWVDGHDGYYYYKKKLSPGSASTSSPVLTKVTGTSDMVATDVLNLHLKVEAITTKGNTYRNAWWEGKEPTSESRPSLQELDVALNALKD